MRALIILSILGAAMCKEINYENEVDTGIDQFSTKMLSTMVKDNNGKSLVASPYSVMTPLAQLALAASGDTHSQLLKGVGLPNDEAIKSVFPTLNAQLRGIKGVTIKSASRIYVTKDDELDVKYSTAVKEIFDSEVKSADFSKNVDVASEINHWVEDQTNNHIKNLVSPDSIDSSTVAMLVNAVYFKGTWDTAFEKKATKNADFNLPNGKKTIVPMMYVKDSFKYGESDGLDAKLLELPFKGSEASLLVILPNKVDGLPTLVEKLNSPGALKDAAQRMFSNEVVVHLPKFKLETTTDLTDVLSKMGITEIFSPRAQLDKMLHKSKNVYISSAIQKAFIEINEEGAEAAAANAFLTRKSKPLQLKEPKIFNVNRQFFFAIMKSSISLFTGVLVDPSQ